MDNLHSTVKKNHQEEMKFIKLRFCLKAIIIRSQYIKKEVPVNSLNLWWLERFKVLPFSHVCKEKDTSICIILIKKFCVYGLNFRMWSCLHEKKTYQLLVLKYLLELGENVGSWCVSLSNLNLHLCPFLNSKNLVQEERSCFFFPSSFSLYIPLGTGQGHVNSR